MQSTTTKADVFRGSKPAFRTTAEAEKLASVEQAIVENPFAIAPPALQLPLAEAWRANQHLLPASALAGAFATWISRHGLTVSDAKRVLEASLRPDRMATYKFPSDFATALASLAARALEFRRKQAAEAKQLAEAKAAKADAEAAKTAVETAKRDGQRGYGLAEHFTNFGAMD